MNKKYKKSFKTKKNISAFSILKSRLFWRFFLLLCVVAAISYLLFFSSAFKVSAIAVMGNKEISSEEIKEAISEQISVSSNIFLASISKASNAAKESLPKIADISIKRKLPSSVIIQIEERKPVVFLEVNSDNYYVDKEGIAYDRPYVIHNSITKIKAYEVKDNIRLGEKVINSEDINKTASIKNKFAALAISLEEIALASKDRINAKTKEGWEVYFNSKKDINWQLTQLEILLKEKVPVKSRENLQYIDLRFEKIYIYPGNLKNPAEE